MARLSYGERKQRKKEKKKAREERQKTRLSNMLLTEADIKDMTLQQKIWIYARTFLLAGCPFLLFMVMPAVCIAVGRVLLYATVYKNQAESVSDALNFYTFCGICLTLYILYRVAKKRDSSIWKETGLDVRNIDFRLLGGLFGFGFLFSVFVSSLLTMIPDSWMTGYDEIADAVYAGYDTLFSIICVSFLSPFAEEIVFRGYMMKRLLPLFKEKKTLWIVSAVFALCHLSPAWIVYGLFLGLVMGVVVLKHGNLAYSLAVHIGFNLFSVLNFIIMKFPSVSDKIYGSKPLILLYGLLAGGAAYLLFRIYTKRYPGNFDKTNLSKEN